MPPQDSKALELSSSCFVPTHRIRLAKVILQDDTGSIILNLWRDQVDQCQVGDIVKVVYAFVRPYKGILELNTGENIEVLERTESSKEE